MSFLAASLATAVLLAVYPPVLDDSPVPPRPPLPPKPDYDKRDPKVVKRNADRVQQLFGALDGLSELSKPAIEAVLGMSLGSGKKAPGGWLDFEVALPDGPFASIEFRAVQDGGCKGACLIWLEPRPSAVLRKTDFSKDFLGDQVTRDALASREGVVRYIRARPNVRNVIVFNLRTGQFAGISLRRGRASTIP
jgi:hypothetical protein